MHFIRHGQSKFNQAFNQSGRDPMIVDAPLTDYGFEQAKRAAQALANTGISRIIASPYTRALQTASVIAEHLNVQIHVKPLAGERSLYSCDIGTPASILREKWQCLDFSALQTEKWWPDTNESLASVQRRVDLFTKKWGEAASGGGFALVSHWYFLNTLTSHDFDNCEVVFKPLFSGTRKSAL